MSDPVQNVWTRLVTAVKGSAVVGNSYPIADDNSIIYGLGLSAPLGVVRAIDVTFVQTTGDGTYTGSVTLPANATLHDIIVSAIALWDGTSASLDVGDATDPNGYFAGVDLTATDLLAGENLSFALAGGKAGAYIAGSQANQRFSNSSRVISGIITQVGTGTLGSTRMTVIYSVPITTEVVSASKA